MARRSRSRPIPRRRPAGRPRSRSGSASSSPARSTASSRRPSCAGSRRRPSRSPAWTIKVVSETIDTHVYESKTLAAKAFSEITGIKVIHDIIQEGDVIEKLQTQMQSGQNVYDMYVNDTDLIGTHYRYGQVVPLTDFMSGEGKAVTSPTLDLDDFIGLDVRHRARQEALPAPRSAVREPVLVPLRLVQPRRSQAELQGQVRLRARRAGELVGVRGHRRLLHQRRQGDRRGPGLRPHGLWQEGPVARVAVHRCLAVDGRRRQHGDCPTACPSTSGASGSRTAGRWARR